MNNNNTTEQLQAHTPLPNEPGERQVLIQRPAHGFLPPADIPAVAPAVAGSPNPAVNVRSVLSALRRRWFIGLSLGSALGAIAAYAAWTFVPAPYTAFTEIRIRSAISNVPLKSSNEETSFNTLKETHMQFIRSHDVLESALRTSKISGLPFFEENEGDQIELLQKYLMVKSNSTEFFRISMSGDRPDDLKAIILAVTKAYKTVVVDADRIAIDRRLKQYKEILAKEDAKLESLREGLRLLVTDDATTSKAFIEKQRGILTLRGDYHQRLADIDLKVMNLEIIKKLQKEQNDKGSKKPIPKVIIDAEMAGDKEYQDLKAEVDKLQSLLKRQKKGLTANHPKIKKTESDLRAAEKTIDALRKKMEPEVRNRLRKRMMGRATNNGVTLDLELIVLKKQREELQRKLKELKVQQRQAGLNDVRIETQSDKIEQQRSYAQALKNEITRMRAQIDLLEDDPRVIIPKRAEVSSRPDTKKKYMGTAAAGFGTFGLVLAGILLLDIRMKRISSIYQLVDRVGLSVLGTIPAMPKMATSRKNGRWSAKARYWHSVLTESVDSARTVLLCEAEQNSLRILMVASAMGGEGKTSVSCHLATSLARAGRNVLLIDGDMRRPFVHETFDIPLKPGFAEMLRSEAELAESLRESGVPGLTIMSAGKISQSALEILAQDRPGELLAELRARFDFIVFDSAPVLPVTDSLLIAQHVDGVLFTVRRDVSRASKVLAGCQKLQKLGVPLLGAIAVGLEDEGYGYGSPYRYGYNPYHSVPQD